MCVLSINLYLEFYFHFIRYILIDLPYTHTECFLFVCFVGPVFVCKCLGFCWNSTNEWFKVSWFPNDLAIHYSTTINLSQWTFWLGFKGFIENEQEILPTIFWMFKNNNSEKMNGSAQIVCRWNSHCIENCKYVLEKVVKIRSLNSLVSYGIHVIMHILTKWSLTSGIQQEQKEFDQFQIPIVAHRVPILIWHLFSNYSFEIFIPNRKPENTWFGTPFKLICIHCRWSLARRSFHIIVVYLLSCVLLVCGLVIIFTNLWFYCFSGGVWHGSHTQTLELISIAQYILLLSFWNFRSAHAQSNRIIILFVLRIKCICMCIRVVIFETIKRT